MARVQYIDSATANETVTRLLEQNGNKNVFRMLAHSESHLRNFCRFGHAIRFKGVLDAGLRELAIIRTGVLCGSDYEVIAHKRIGAEVGLAPAKLDAVESGSDATVFTPLESMVVKFADAVVQTSRPDDELFEGLLEALGIEALVELHLAIGYYIMTSKFLTTFDIDPQ